MNRLARWMMRLYPAQWRARYGDEVDALVTDTGADARTVADLAKGGFRMRFLNGSFPKLAVTFGLAGLFLGGLLGVFLPSQYTSKATIQIVPARVDAGMASTDSLRNPLNEHVLLLANQALSRARLVRIIGRLDLYPAATQDDVVERMRNNIHINFVAAPVKFLRSGAAFDIVFTYPDRYKAQQTVQALMGALNEINVTSSMRTDTAMDRAGSILVLDEASLPTAPFSLHGTVVIVGAFLASVLVAILWRVIQHRGLIVRRFALVAMTLGAIGIITVITMDRLQILPYQYRSVASLRLNHGTNEQLLEIKARVLSRDSLFALINNPRLQLYRDEARTKSPDDVLALMRSHLQVSNQGDHGGAVFDIAFDYQDRYKARQVVEALTDWFAAVSAGTIQESARVLSARGPVETPVIMDVLDTPNLPTTPSKPNRSIIALAGGFGGVICGAIVSIIRRRWTPPAIAPLNAVRG